MLALLLICLAIPMTVARSGVVAVAAGIGFMRCICPIERCLGQALAASIAALAVSAATF